MQLQAYFNHSLLKPTATKKEIIQLCNEAKQHNLYSVCVNSCNVFTAKNNVIKSDVKVCATIGFPFGTASPRAKVMEAKKAIEDGADEIDMVINLGMLKGMNYVGVYKDIRDVKLAIGKKPLKVIIEISELSKNEILRICQICIDAKADFIKTSTGFSKSGATFIAVKMIKKTLKGLAKIEASGDIKDIETSLKYIDVGADRIGTTHSAKIMEEIINQQIVA
ncbi:deoxyribose-phosphate aldolase [Flavobacteriaceae bacterium S0825]|uniref:deoxyribose-phosphate aldolase n=1 Tax=Gaetbulibacter sp. S0825 TaxID=2720084 RepID=UPI001431A149|nr:deoxyribose-phosphate aldolase [Gaetbulibacter sp. S0825]MCK0109214.1 deoxyribose-phosphate aldolase [Flavobacteriaceae bacterium S0825]NIX64849.1 deoxyribose-phosphate aldolase [Gaetbulibacter sp. S0825]